MGGLNKTMERCERRCENVQKKCEEAALARRSSSLSSVDCYSAWYDKIRRDSSALYSPRQSLTPSSTASSSRSTSESEPEIASKVLEDEPEPDIEDKGLIEDPTGICEALTAWVKQLGSIHGDPFLGLGVVEEKSPLPRKLQVKADPYYGLQWDVREHWGVEEWEGPVDERGRWHGKGVVRMANGGTVIAVWKNGRREGKSSTMAPEKGILSLLGEYRGGKMTGLVKIIREDDSMVEGHARDGCLHGLVRRLDSKRRLSWVGRYMGGRPAGHCWSLVAGGGAVTGPVDSQGSLSGEGLAYIYPDFHTVLLGSFLDGVLVSGRAATISALRMEQGVPVLQYSTPNGPLRFRELSTQDWICSQPTMRDPYEALQVEVRESLVEDGGEGVFALQPLAKKTVIAFYNGVRLPPVMEAGDWEDCSYRIFLHTDEEEEEDFLECLDIPCAMRDLGEYCATLGHKINHSFSPNCEFSHYSHPLYGEIPCVVTTQHVDKGEELFSYYHYLLSDCPEWYAALWQTQ